MYVCIYLLVHTLPLPHSRVVKIGFGHRHDTTKTRRPDLFFFLISWCIAGGVGIGEGGWWTRRGYADAYAGCIYLSTYMYLLYCAYSMYL